MLTEFFFFFFRLASALLIPARRRAMYGPRATRTSSARTAAGHVLATFRPDERDLATEMVALGADAAERWLHEGIDEAVLSPGDAAGRLFEHDPSLAEFAVDGEGEGVAQQLRDGLVEVTGRVVHDDIADAGGVPVQATDSRISVNSSAGSGWLWSAA